MRNSTVRTVAIFLFTVIVGLGIPGCGGEATIWSTQLRSPDGRWLASAKTVENSGFGTGSLATYVYLKWTNGSQAPENILLLIHDPNSSSRTINLSMKWVTPSHLDVSYNGSARVDFQVVKYGDVDISLHDLSNIQTDNSP
ncbi:MAG: hypothetical protein WBQ34_14235 [Candidatus Acidiferrales bacterium]